jgi:hypothetical protein
MTSLTDAIWQWIMPLVTATVEDISTEFKEVIPKKSGATAKSVGWFTYGNGQWVVKGSSMLAKLEEGDDPDIMNRKVTQTYTRRTSTGKSITVSRTYTGMRPQKLWKKSAGGGNPWRVVAMYPRPPMGLTAKVMGKVLKSIGTKAKSILPSTIEITSFD